MISYVYWIGVVLVSACVLFFLVGSKQWKAGIVSSLAILLIGWLAYFFHFEQMFVKNYGGVMSIEVPEGQLHIGITWKEDNLWIENFDPKTNTCYFSEYAKGSLLEGSVAIKNCNPASRAVMFGSSIFNR